MNKLIPLFLLSAFSFNVKAETQMTKSLKCIGKAYAKRNLSLELNDVTITSLKTIHEAISSRTPLSEEQADEICELVNDESYLSEKLSRKEAKRFRQESLRKQYDSENLYARILNMIIKNDVVDCRLGGVEVSAAVFVGLGAGAKGGTCIKSTGRKYVAGGISVAANWGLGVNASLEKSWLRDNYESQDDEKVGFILTATLPLGQGGEDLNYHGDYGIKGAGLGYGFMQEKKMNIVPLLFPTGWDFEWIIRKIKRAHLLPNL